MSVVDEVKQRVDIVELISRSVQLKKAGRNFTAPCPFHTERTPSFVVFPHTGTWRCFGACGIGGDAFNFLMHKESLEFREALEMLAQEVGVNLDNNNDGQSERQRKGLYEINGAAALYFREVLLNHNAADVARAYLVKRQIDVATAERFQIGYALDSWDGLRSHLEKRGYDIEQQLEAGLIKHNERRDSTYDAFRGRLMIPILDRQSRVIGFGGRILEESQKSDSSSGGSTTSDAAPAKPMGPKYLNTAETPIFHKSNVVYGLNLAHKAIRQESKVVVVEGYMDVIAAHQNGFENVVACMGTSLTAEQLRQLQRYTNEYLLALDADAAGQQATIRGLNQARQALKRVRRPKLSSTGQVHLQEQLGANLSIVPMPEGRDPDDVIRHDPLLWQELIDSALPLVDYYLQNIVTQYDLQSAQGKGLAVSDVAPLIAELGDEIEQQHYIQQLSRLIQIDESTIASRVQAAARTLRIAKQRNAIQGTENTEDGGKSSGTDSSKSSGTNRAADSNGLQNREYNKPRQFGKKPAEGVADGEKQSGPKISRDSSSFVPAENHLEQEPPPDFDDGWVPEMESSVAPNQQSISKREGTDSAGLEQTQARPHQAAAFVQVSKEFDQEDYLLAYLLWEPNLLVWLANKTSQLQIHSLEISDFNRVENREIFKVLRQFITSDEQWDYEMFRESVIGYLHGSLGTLLDYADQQPSIDPTELQAELVKVLLRIRITNLKAATKNIKFLQDDAQRSGDSDLAKTLSISINHNTRERFHFEKALANIGQSLSKQPRTKKQKILLQ